MRFAITILAAFLMAGTAYAQKPGPNAARRNVEGRADPRAHDEKSWRSRRWKA